MEASEEQTERGDIDWTEGGLVESSIGLAKIAFVRGSSAKAANKMGCTDAAVAPKATAVDKHVLMVAKATSKATKLGASGASIDQTTKAARARTWLGDGTWQAGLSLGIDP